VDLLFKWVLVAALFAAAAQSTPLGSAKRESGFWWAHDWDVQHEARKPVIPPVNCAVWADEDFRIGCESYLRDKLKARQEDGLTN
jgi:hypothetical protein